MACHLDRAKPLSKPMLEYSLLDPIFIQDDAFENVVWKMVAILSSIS